MIQCNGNKTSYEHGSETARLVLALVEGFSLTLLFFSLVKQNHIQTQRKGKKNKRRKDKSV